MTTPSDHRSFGKTGLAIPPVVFGATALGNLFVAIDEQQKADLIGQWFAQMPKPIAIDTAGKYGAGLSLEVIGRQLSRLQIDPAEIILSNKLGWRRVPLVGPEPTFEPGVWIDIQHDAIQDISYDGILRCYEEGCRMLGNYRPALVSVHDPDEFLAAAVDPRDRRQRMDQITEAYRALTELRDAGQVAGVGVGAKDWRIIRELADRCDLDWVMIANSFTIMHHPPELITWIESLASQNVGLINSALMHGGFLIKGNFFDYRPLEPDDANDRQRIQWRRRFHAVCEKFHQHPFEVAVAFGASHPAVHAVALSTSRPDRVAAMIAAASNSMPAELWSALKSESLIDPGYPYL